jgi:molybdopterin-guanine dinucleotide biosynthesis protein A
VAARDPARIATAFRSACDGLPEPLCAIYEPAARERLKAFVARGVLCPRKALIESSVLLLDPADGRALENVNRPDEYRSASGPAGAEVRIRYFAMLREQAGRTEETVRTEAATPRALWEELSARHGFRAPLSVLRVAVNEEFVSAEHALREGDTVAFIPPVAGG